MKAYLSIDLDYWRRQETPLSCAGFFRRVWSLGLPIYVAMYHHHLLPHINGNDCDVLINVDYHSDLADLEKGRVVEFNEGTWGNFIDWRYKGTFIWRYPLPECLHTGVGYCHEEQNPFVDPRVARWERTKERLGLYGIPWQNIAAVGVCLSPDWIGRVDVLAEPLTKLRVNHWLTDHYRKTNCGRDPRRRQPKFVRVKV